MTYSPETISGEAGNEQFRQYEFYNHSARAYTEFQDVAEYAENSDLGQDVVATILVKWTNQTYHDENLRAMFSPEWDPVAGISRTNAWRHRNRYYDGLIVRTSLEAGYLDAQSAEYAVPAVQPTGISMRADGMTAFACGDKILLSPDGDPRHIAQTIGHLMFARLHSVEFNPSGDRLLTASSSLDVVHEVTLEGSPDWTFDAWRNTSFNVNTLGQRFYRTLAGAPEGSLINPSSQVLKDDQTMRGAHCVLDNPDEYDRLGLTTNLTPVFVNTASYGTGDTILATAFHKGEAWVIDRTAGRVAVVASGMRNPHGLHRDPLLDGYMVTDTGNERVSFISGDNERELAIEFSTLGERKPGLEQSRWLQYVTRIGDNLYCAVVAPRQKITLFDPIEQTKRDIPFDPEWGIQQVVTQ
jgi:hypothetical protein